MKLPEFVRSREPQWEELERLLEEAGGRPERLGAEGVHRLAFLYRSVSADLAVARSRFPADPVTERLERQVARARAAVYQGTGRRIGIVSFLAETYWRLVYERRRQVTLAAALLLVPGLLGVLWGLTEPDALSSQLPPQFLWVTEADTTDQGYGTAGLIGFSTFVLTNNIRVTLLAFALGIVWGLGTAWILLQNGLILGGIAGLAIGAGNTPLFLAAVMAHGILELSCILVGGAAGLSLGRAILRPGRLTRREALGREALVAVQLAGGTALWLVLAGFVEGFASRTGLPWLPATLIGLALGGLFWTLVVLRGATLTAEPSASP